MAYRCTFGTEAGQLQLVGGESSPSDEHLADVLEAGLRYFPGKGFIQLAFPTAESLQQLFEALGRRHLWCYCNEGDDGGAKAGSWSFSLLDREAVTALRSHAPNEPSFARLLLLHDVIERVANELQTNATEEHGQRRKGHPSRQGNALQNLWLRLAMAISTRRNAMSLTDHRDGAGKCTCTCRPMLTCTCTCTSTCTCSCRKTLPARGERRNLAAERRALDRVRRARHEEETRGRPASVGAITPREAEPLQRQRVRD